jgi:class 3 adenylate cyclase
MRIVALLALLLAGLPAAAQVIVWNGGNRGQAIAQQVYYLRDSTRSLTLEQIRTPAYAASFQPWQKKTLLFPYDEDAYWMRFEVANPSDEPLLLELSQPLLADAELWYRDTAGSWRVYRAGYAVNLYEKTIPHHYQLFPLQAGRGEYYLRVIANGFVVPLEIWNANRYDVKAARQHIVYGLYAGLVLFVILNNLFLFFSLGRSGYLHYAFLIFLYGHFSLLFDGYWQYLFPDSDAGYWYFLNPIVNQPNGLLYCLMFLEIRKYDPWGYRLALPVFWYFLSYIFWYRFLPDAVVFPLNELHALIGIFLMATLGIRAGLRGNRLGYYFAGAYFVFFPIASIEVLRAHTGSPDYIAEISYISLAFLIDIFILAYLLTKRFNWEKAAIEQARAEAQQQLLEKTRENERMVLAQNAALEDKVERRTRQLRQANEELSATLETVEKERGKSEALLLNILPAATAQELKETGAAKPQNHPSVTVLFTDFSDFTRTTASIDPDQLVSNLDHCFSHYDEIVQRHGLEKIKTIGDAYLAVAGLYEADGNHALQVVRAAIDILAFMERWKAEQLAVGRTAWDVRIGIHTGPVVSGVVGRHKFAYDIWGDTVNTAARLETHSVPGRANISEATYALIRDHFHCTPRGMVEAKGKGDLQMYWVEAPVEAVKIE